MPKTARAKRNKKKPSQSPEAQRETLYDLIADMEAPLKSALDLAGILYFIGLGLSAIDDDAADPILELSGVQTRLLEQLAEQWKAIFDASANSARDPR